MSLKSFKRRGRQQWKADTDTRKHPSNPHRRSQGREDVREWKVLAHRYDRRQAKRSMGEE